MPQDWVNNDENSGGDTVRQGMINLEQKLDSLRSSFSGSSFPVDADRYVGQPCWRTDTGETTGIGLYVLTVKDPTPASDTWVFCFGDAGLTLFGESIGNAADAAAVRTLLALGTAALLVSGTGSGDVQINSQNDSRFLRRDQDLGDLLDIPASRTSLGLGALAILGTVGTAQIGASAVTSAKLATSERTFLSQVGQNSDSSAVAGQYVSATIGGTSWTLDLPVSPNAGDRVQVNVISTTVGKKMTVDGGAEFIGVIGTTTVELYAYGDMIEVVYSGAGWTILNEKIQPHRAQMSIAGFTRSGTSFITVPFDTVDFDNSGMADITADRMTIKRDGIYFVEGQLLASQTGPLRFELELRKNGVRTSAVEIDDLHEWSASTMPGGGQLSGYYSLVTGDYLEFFQAQDINASPASFGRLTVIEHR